MSKDIIYREDAIKAINLRARIPHDVASAQYASMAINAIRSVPSADRPQGEWIKDYNGNGWNDYWDYTCFNCGKKYERADFVLYNANFCPNCGAEIEGVKDD